MIKTSGYGLRGPKGDTGATGGAGSTGAKGDKGDTGAQGIQGAQGVKGDTGSSATATPLGTAAPQLLGAASAGISGNAAREDHVHALPAGRLVLVGNVTVTETLLISLALGVRRMALPLTGITVGDKLLAIPNGTPTTGCEVLNAYPGTVNNVSIGYYTPALGIGATYSIPVSVYRIMP